jgi:conserved oligomeric Golgi complex subunit 6
MKSDCDEAETQLRLMQQSGQTLLKCPSSSREERCVFFFLSPCLHYSWCHGKEVEDKRLIVNLFLMRFTLTEEEIDIAKSREIPIRMCFFQMMDKAEKIRNDCQVLMAGEDGPTQAGYAPLFLSIVEPMFLLEHVGLTS